MKKWFGWGLLRVLKTPTLGIPFKDHIPIRGKFTVEVKGKAMDMASAPTPKQLKQPWTIVAEDQVAEGELAKAIHEELLRAERVNAEIDREGPRIRRDCELLKMTADSIPWLKADREETSTATFGENARLLTPNVFTKCEISQVVQLPRLPNEDMFVADMGQMVQGHTEKPAAAKESQAATHHPFPQNYIQFMQHVARKSDGGGGPQQLRVNKLLHERVDETQEGDSDYICTLPNEDIPCSFNTLFYVQVKREGITDESTEELLREGVARVVYRILEMDNPGPRPGLGVVCNGRDILFVKVDLEEKTVPVYVSKILRLDSEEGLRHWARFLCCSSAEAFGLPARNLFEVLRLPSHYSYVRALGSGGFADVVEVHDEAMQRNLACKLARDLFHGMAMLNSEAQVLKKLKDVAGVPRLVSCSFYDVVDQGGKSSDLRQKCALLTSPVGTPLHEHMKSLQGEGARHSFALRVLEELKPVLSAVHARGIVHGDIKPDNLVVGPDGQVFLIDWGNAVFTGTKGKPARQQQPEQKEEEKEELGHTPFQSDELLLGAQSPIAQDDEKALLLTVVAIHKSSVALAPWPYYECPDGVQQQVQARARWLEEYAHTHPELDLSPLLPLSRAVG